ncbi:MAG: flagellar biosynthesis protein FlhA [Gracilimonas sp.]|uniref:flagellar biosynthesis protein FlhA n=1 Tax=Gracilimonas TaxID=649462 RepID=UPI001B133689|nr:flagellar biosynthesis protein FlhA [Gracilimonas sp.]MBO6586834.1 flagellar biosynthesis protein FlhA [Gracilimonas sp.]MBO6614678.1 flagellar biosynthesis protein FlhA [Gracilimonas sp.]
MAFGGITTEKLKGTFFQTDVLISSSIIMILLIMIIPFPTQLMDFFLALNISLSLIVMLVAFYALKPLQFAVFPGMLLILTLFRLSLNVGTTRLILSEGYAGSIIESFGGFIVQGNFVIGIIIFAVLIIINFVVITKGATRIAEVAARFTLDAMPGKQMSIDADLAAGLLTDEEAKKKREEIAREADFYGAMDGASKFVRGDVIAGLLITFINIIGGLIIGTVQLGMPIGAAAAKYTLMTIGDGLVSQIPGLLISTAAGIMVSRAASEGNLGNELKFQLLGNPKTVIIGAVFVFFMGMLPGLPVIPFWSIAGFFLFMGVKNFQREEDERLEEEAAETKELSGKAEDPVENYLLMDTLELEIGYSLIPMVEANQGGDLLDRMTSLRKQLASELGIIIPSIRIRDNVQLDANHYTIKMRGIMQGDGEILPGYHLTLLPADFKPDIQGIETKDPTFGMDAIWVSGKNKSQAEKYGLSVIESGAVITTHLMEVLKKNAHKLVDRQMVKKLIDNIKEQHSALVEELIPDGMKVGEIQKVLKRLLRERVPVKDLVTILETLADYCHQTNNTDVLTEYCRAALSETITRQYANNENEVTVVMMDSNLESHLIAQAQQGTLNSNTLGLTPETVEKLYKNSSATFDSMIRQGFEPILLTSPVLRFTLFEFLAPILPDINVLSYNDISQDVQFKTFGRLKIEDPVKMNQPAANTEQPAQQPEEHVLA